MCSPPHQLGCGQRPHADLDADLVQTWDFYCTIAESIMQTRKPVAVGALQGCKIKKQILSPLRLPFRHAPRSHRNAFRGFVAANACPIGADMAAVKPPSASR